MTDAASHGQLMDDVYRYQRLFYDITRKHYLLGRDHLIAAMEVRAGERVLEVACGTGRNLAAIGRRYPGAELYGFDISEQMLISARRKLGATARLGQGDACSFDPVAMFGQSGFDHIVFSYSLSMIPDWEAALAEALCHLAPGGRLHIVDFGDQAGLPMWFKRMLRAWLARFHVAPRDTLPDALHGLAGAGRTARVSSLRRGYATYGCLRRDV
ncbi:class I SAM-dependent methyltransferase [Psychromarinibacter sp. S121]|uniref:class I SAM-dependent methyltransferase n=1 Tax=Psychromarinibacter sp. S121 TaxID=3415127 RepID=UPI003C7E78B3